MSERGSFVTEYIYCPECYHATEQVLVKHFQPLQRVLWDGVRPINIVAGFIRGSWGGEEIFYFENEVEPEISKEICHPVRIAVLAEDGERIFKIEPEKKE